MKMSLVTLCLSLTSFNAVAADRVNNLNFEISTQLTVPARGQNYSKEIANYEMVVNDSEPFCVESMALSQIGSGWPEEGQSRFDGRDQPVRLITNRPSGGMRYCALTGYAKTQSGRRVLVHRDVKAALSYNDSKLTVQGGLGLFGALLNTVTLGLSNAVFGAVDTATASAYDGMGATSLQTSFVRAVEQKAAAPVILNDLILLQCQIEAAELAKYACPGSKVASQADYLRQVRFTYMNFINRYKGKSLR